MAARPAASEPITMGNWSDLPPQERPGYVPAHVQYAPTGQQFAYTAAPASAPAYTAPLRNPAAASSGGYQYANPPSNITYTPNPTDRHPQSNPSSNITYTSNPVGSNPQPPPVRHDAAPPYPTQQMQPQYAAMPAPQEHHRASSQSGPPMGQHEGRHVVEMRPHSQSLSSGRPEGLRMDRLSVSGNNNRPNLHTLVPGGMPGDYPGGLPPPSPLLEAYHGTYQSISPMPQAMMLDDDLDHLPALDTLSPRGSGSLRHGRHRAHSSSGRSPSPAPHSKRNDKLALEAYGRGDRLPEKETRRARIYDATDDALALVDALASRTPNLDTIIDILPALSHDQMLELRAEYKRHCKVQGRGINIAKHIKLKTSGNFGKIAYVTALGRFEGEGYWANYWYQSNSARRELLIESLMGRQNHEIRAIKESFKDKRYGDSLTRCMDKELKADKFRKAVLMALEAERQEESDVWPVEYRNRDVDTLYKAMKAREGGESTMLSVVIMRSDTHLREVLRTYERKYQGNFARDALKKSNNLVVRLPPPFHYMFGNCILMMK